MSILLFLLAVAIGLVALAWYDGGRVEQRLIEGNVDLDHLPQGATE